MLGMAAATAALAVPDAAVRRRSGLAAAVAAAGAVACVLSIAAPALHGLPLHVVDQSVHAGVAASYLVAAVVALLRRPGNATGAWMAAVGFLWLVQDLYWIWAPLPYTVASTYEKVYQPALATLALVFPTGRFSRGFDRRVMVGVWIWTLVNNPVRMLFFDPNANGCLGCRQLLLVGHNPGAYRVIEQATTYLSAVIIIAVTGVIVRHWRLATRAARRVMQPVLWMVIPTVAFLLAQQFADVVVLPSAARHVINDYLPVGLTVLPVGFLVGLLRTRRAYAQVGELLPQLNTGLAPGRVRDALAATLRDPDLELLYWSPAGDCYVDLDGQAYEPTPRPGRVVHLIEGVNGPLAAMIVDETALAEPALLSSAAALARLALENEWLHAEVRSQLVQLRSSTTRILEAGQDARRRIERDLHDGAQQRLLALSMVLGQARTKALAKGDAEVAGFLARAAEELQQAINELRELARGIHPMLLIQEGLASAVRALAERAPLPIVVSAPTARFPGTVEATAYFFVSEAVTNAARHSRASGVWVELVANHGQLTIRVRDDGIGGAGQVDADTGSGLQGMRDRVLAVGGRMTIASPPGGGTTVTARLPCG